MISLMLLTYGELPQNAWVPPAWVGLTLFAMVLGMVFLDSPMLYQSVILLIPVVIGMLIFNFPEAGTLLGRESSGTAIGGLFLARILWQMGIHNRRARYIAEGVDSTFLLRTSRHLYSLPAAILLAILIPMDLSGDLAKYQTLGWGIEGLLLIVMGFSMSDRLLRISGLVVLGLGIFKVFYDLSTTEIELKYKVLALIGLGVILLVTAWIYARFRERIHRTFLAE